MQWDDRSQEELAYKFGTHYHATQFNKEDSVYDRSKFYENSITNGFLTHSCNGYFLNQIKEHGLGCNKHRDEKLEKEFEYLEQFFGGHKFAKNYARADVPQFYATGPGLQSIYYAMQQSPERLFLGILCQEHTDALPIKVGETRAMYAMRVIEHKIAGLSLDENTKTSIRGTATSLFGKLLTQDPAILFIPISEVSDAKVMNQGLNVEEAGKDWHTLTQEEKLLKMQTVGSLINRETIYGDGEKNPNKLFQQESGGYYSNLCDLAIYNKIIPLDKMGVLRVKSSFDVQQELAKKQGLESGDEIPYFDKYLSEQQITLDPSKKLHPLRLLINNIQNGVQQAKINKLFELEASHPVEKIITGAQKKFKAIKFKLFPDKSLPEENTTPKPEKMRDLWED